MAVNDVWQVTGWFANGVETAATSLHYRLTTEGDDDITTQGKDIAADVAALFANLTDAICTAGVQLNAVTSHRVNPLGSRVFVNFPEGAVGGQSGEENAAQLAVLVSIYTDVQTKNGRGRMYFPFPAEGISNSGQILTARAAAINVILGNLLTTAITTSGGNEWEAVVFSPTLHTAQAVVDWQIQPVLATQKRRRQSRQPLRST